ncbi:MAG: hypothetical protein R2747_05835 [Pyrinomonadaceae bacterium]
MNKMLLKSMTVFFALTALLFLNEGVSAQRKEARGKKYTKAQVERVVNRVEERVDNFVKHYDKSLDRSSLNGTEREDWLMKRAKDLESATDELRREFDRNDDWFENKAEVRRCLNIASDIDKNMKNRRYSRDTENIWVRVRYELNTLADIYNLPKVGSAAY